MLLLHVCCGPCAIPVLERYFKRLKAGQNNLVLYFDNPNIWPFKEKEKRLDAVAKIADLYQTKLMLGSAPHSEWRAFLKSKLSQPLRSYSENGERCSACFEFRLEKTALFAKQNNFQEFATTLSLSRFKDTKSINQFGKKLAKKYGLIYQALKQNYSKKQTKEQRFAEHKKNIEFCQKHDLYRQKYCGCEFSLPQAFDSKKLKV